MKKLLNMLNLSLLIILLGACSSEDTPSGGVDKPFSPSSYPETITFPKKVLYVENGNHLKGFLPYPILSGELSSDYTMSYSIAEKISIEKGRVSVERNDYNVDLFNGSEADITDEYLDIVNRVKDSCFEYDVSKISDDEQTQTTISSIYKKVKDNTYRKAGYWVRKYEDGKESTVLEKSGDENCTWI